VDWPRFNGFAFAEAHQECANDEKDPDGDSGNDQSVHG
jgi:hypothetical protein